MGSEPERPIEKLLRACAKKRVDDAQAGFELHPATRRVLQGEVARRFRRPEVRRAPISDFLAGIGPRLAWAVGVVAALVVLGTLVVPMKDRGRQELAFTLEREVVVPGDDRGALLKDSVPGQESKLESAAAPVSLAEASPMSAATPPAANGPADRAQVAFNAPAVQSKQAEVAVDELSIAARETDSERLRESSVAQGSFEYAKADLRRQLALGVNFTSAQAQASSANDGSKSKGGLVQPLLASFQLRQAGDRVQFVDSDGSIYEGRIQPIEVPGTRGRIAFRTAAPAPQTRLARTDQKVSLSTASDSFQEMAPTLYTFNVAGTNVTLGQRVVFTGSLTGVTNLASFLAGTSSFDKGLVLKQQAPANGRSEIALPGPASPRVSGRAVLDGRDEVQVQAVYSGPVAP